MFAGKTTVAAALAAALMAGPAWGQCVSVEPTFVPDIPIDPLDAAGAAAVVQPVSLTFRRIGSEREKLDVIFQVLDEDSTIPRIGIYAGPQVEWQSVKGSRNIGVTRNEPYSFLRSGQVVFNPNSGSEQATLRLYVQNLHSDLPAGTYREQFTIRYWCGGDTSSNAPVEATGVLSATVRVPNVLSATVAGLSSQGEVDFYDFETLSRSLSISVQGTGPYEVSARSENNGAMFRDGARIGDEDRVAYRIEFEGRALAPDGSARIRYPRAGLAGRQAPLVITAEDVSKKRAGRYSDTIILTLAPVT